MKSVHFEKILNNNLIFIFTLVSIIALSTIFNTFSIYKFKIIKKKISLDYIKLQLWIINLVFTFIAIPYFIFKELDYFKSKIFECKLLYAATDFIMFVYNNLLILIAIDRYLFICTRLNLKLDQIFIPFYTITLAIASTSMIRLFQNSCSNSILSEESSLINLYNYFIIIIMSINMILTFLIYIKIIIFVYKKEAKVKNHIQMKLVDFKQNLNKSNGNKQLNTIISIQKKTYIKMFKNTKHWTIMIVFIKVKLIIIIKILFYLIFFFQR